MKSAKLRMRALRRVMVLSSIAAAAALQAFNQSSSAATLDATWTGPAIGSWNNIANWSGALVPNNGVNSFNVFIDAGNVQNTAVTLDLSPQILGLTVTSADQLTLANNTQLQIVGGTFSNAGTVTIGAAANNSTLRFDTTPISLNGGGTIIMSQTGGGAAQLFGNVLITNANNTIRGQGVIAGNNNAFTNQGTVVADVNGAVLSIDTVNGANTLTNTGRLLASGGGALQLSGFGGGSALNTGGTISALNGSEVRLTSNISISGGTLTTVGTGSINVVAGQNAFIDNLTSTGNIVILNNADLNVSGTLTNSASINANAVANTARILGSGTWALSGGGIVNLNQTGGGGIASVGGSGTLFTNNTIQGAGALGSNNIFIVNSGTVLANNGTQSLTIDTVNVAGSFVNNGTLTANGGVLVLTGFGGGDFQNTAGRIIAGSTDVQLTSGVSITGGTFTSTGAGIIRVNAGQTANLANNTINANLTLDNNSVLNWSGTLTNNGSININAGSNNSAFNIVGGGTGTISGTGTIFMNQGVGGIGGVPVIGGAGTIVLNAPVRGAGALGANQIGIINNSTITATDSANALGLDSVNAASSFVNNGTLAANGGVLLLTGFGGGGFINNGRIIAGTTDVQFTANASVTGGSLNSSGTGILRVLAGQAANFANITLNGNMTQDNNSQINWSGTWTNNGSININAGTNNTILSLASIGTLVGGTVNLNVTGAGGVPVLQGGGTLVTSATMRGAGNIGGNNLFITNTGTVLADNAANSLTIDPINAGNSFINNGTLIANAGTLSLSGFGLGGFDNTNGRIIAGTTDVQLINSVGITGGTLVSSGAGVIRVPVSQTANFASIALNGNLTMDNNSQVNWSGVFANNGSINVNAGANSTIFSLGSSGTLLGGTVNLSQTGAGGIAVLQGGGTLATNSFFRGAGNIGGNNLFITSSGTILADNGTMGLTIDPINAGNSFINKGTLTANGGILILTGSGFGGFDNTTGRIIAGTTDVQLVGGVGITGGTLASSGAGVLRVPVGQTANFLNITLNGNITADNNSQINWSGSFANNGSINISAGTNSTIFNLPAVGTLTGGLVNMLQTGSGGFAVMQGGGTLFTSGTIQGAGLVGSNNLFITNTGTIQATNPVAALTVDPVNAGNSLVNNGTLLANGGILVLTGSGLGAFDNTGARVIAGSTDVQLVAGVNVTGGTLQSSGAGVIRVPVSNTANFSSITLNGNLVVESNALLNWSNTFTNLGSINLTAGASNTAMNLVGGGFGTLNGGGIVNLTTTGAGVPVLGSNGTLVTNNTIRGLGVIGGNQNSFTTSGLVDANISGATLSLDPNNGGSGTNTGTWQASNGGILSITGSGLGGFNSVNGYIKVLPASTLNTITSSSLAGGSVQLDGTWNHTGSSIATVKHIRGSGTLNISSSAVVQVNPDGTAAGASTVNSLSITTSGKLDLTNNTLKVHYGANPTPAADIRAMLAAGRGSGDWHGTTGVVSSTVANAQHALGYKDSGAGDITVMYTLTGDTNLDGVVGFMDLLPFAAYYNHPGSWVWADGDFTYDGNINFSDLVPFAANYGKTLAAFPALPVGLNFSPEFVADWNKAAAMVPEPTSLLTLCCAGLLLRRHRK